MTLAIGHRGACGHELENTLRSIQKGIVLGADMLEFDVRITKDCIPVVLHDSSIRRVSGRRGLVARLSLEECRRAPLLDGSLIPTLEEACSLIKESSAKAYIEAKVRDRKGAIIGKVLELLPIDKFYIASFDKTYLTLIEKQYPEVHTIAITNRKGGELSSLIEKNPADCFSVEFRSIDREVVEIAHSRGRRIFAWTVNDPEEIQRMKALGVDGIVSDFPERIK